LILSDSYILSTFNLPIRQFSTGFIPNPFSTLLMKKKKRSDEEKEDPSKYWMRVGKKNNLWMRVGKRSENQKRFLMRVGKRNQEQI